MTPSKKLISAFSEVIESLSNDFIPREQYDKMAQRLAELEKCVKELSAGRNGEATSALPARKKSRSDKSGRTSGSRGETTRKRTYKADYLKLISVLRKDPQREFCLKELVRATGYNEKKVRNMLFIYSRDKFGYVNVVRRGVYKAGKPVGEGERRAA